MADNPYFEWPLRNSNMTRHPKCPGRAATIFTAISLLVQPFAPFIESTAASGQATTKPAATPTQKPTQTPAKPAAVAGAKPAAAAATTTPVDGGWPRLYELSGGGTILMYQPQIASWEKQAHMVAFSAVSHRAKAEDKPALGTLKIEADSKVATAERVVSLQNLKIVEANFQTLPKEQVREIVAAIDKAFPDDERVIALDRVLANIDKSTIVPKNVEGVKADPPTVFFSKTPAVIVNLDGEPIWSPIKENDLKFAVNTNWDLFQHTPTNTYYLRHNDSWLKAADVKGPWTPAGKLPESFAKLPAEDNWKEVRENLPGKPIKKGPQVFVSVQPAELDSAERRAELPPGFRYQSPLGEQHR